MWYSLALAVLAGYFLGNLNGAVTMSVLHGREDIRAKGSGNAGLTNYFRNYGGMDTLLVLAIDVGKTLLACLLAGRLMAPYGLWREGVMAGGLAVILGHNFPALLGFRGGKGIVCSAFPDYCGGFRSGLRREPICFPGILLSGGGPHCLLLGILLEQPTGSRSGDGGESAGPLYAPGEPFPPGKRHRAENLSAKG